FEKIRENFSRRPPRTWSEKIGYSSSKCIQKIANLKHSVNRQFAKSQGIWGPSILDCMQSSCVWSPRGSRSMSEAGRRLPEVAECPMDLRPKFLSRAATLIPGITMLFGSDMDWIETSSWSV